LGLVLQHHPNRTLTHLGCVPRQSVHAPILSRFGASEKAGAVQSRANAYLERCNTTGRRYLSDFGLIAAARQRMLDHEPSPAWALLRPRLRALLSQPEVTRQEVETLTLIAGLAARLPEADDAMLSQASQLASQSASLDGAGPRVRLGAALLRDALCVRSPGCLLRTSTRVDEDALLKRLIVPSGAASAH
ncbi:hypothetical protein, partial [Silanimonas sp.]|uniref:hypothetical protein n=1 Tax=Silanimonas sp. TaxID=1929290 RepID=UPI0037CA351F